MDDGLSRAAGALHGLAVGDAPGMPAQPLPRSQIVSRYGRIASPPPARAGACQEPGQPWPRSERLTKRMI
jgi:ADP-ribosylglycohydrolase